jgi:hypothetical protein
MRAVTNMVLGSLLGISLALAGSVTAHAGSPTTLMHKAAGTSQEVSHAPTDHHWPRPDSPGIFPNEESALHHVAPLTPYIVGFLAVGIIVLVTTGIVRLARRRKS